MDCFIRLFKWLVGLISIHGMLYLNQAKPVYIYYRCKELTEGNDNQVYLTLYIHLYEMLRIDSKLFLKAGAKIAEIIESGTIGSFRYISLLQ